MQSRLLPSNSIVDVRLYKHLNVSLGSWDTEGAELAGRVTAFSMWNHQRKIKVGCGGAPTCGGRRWPTMERTSSLGRGRVQGAGRLNGSMLVGRRPRGKGRRGAAPEVKGRSPSALTRRSSGVRKGDTHVKIIVRTKGNGVGIGAIE